MGQVEDFRLFVQVVESGSISKAAERLGIAKSAVSRRLGLLESRFDTRLIDRDPGNWELTRTGQELLQRAMHLLRELDDLEDDFKSTSAVAEGPLTVSVPREFGTTFLNPALIAFKQRYPEIRLSVDFDDRSVDLLRENYDLALRIARIQEMGTDAIRIGAVQHHLYASRDYVATHPPIHDICDLKGHKFLHFGSARRAYWEFLTPTGKSRRFEFAPHLNSNSGLFLLSAVKAGLGIARMPSFIVGQAESTGEIVRLLPEAPHPEWGIYLIHAENRHLNRRMRLFTEEMKQACLLCGET